MDNTTLFYYFLLLAVLMSRVVYQLAFLGYFEQVNQLFSKFAFLNFISFFAKLFYFSFSSRNKDIFGLARDKAMRIMVFSVIFICQKVFMPRKTML